MLGRRNDPAGSQRQHHYGRNQLAKAEYFVGVDLGGTKILAGVFKNSLEMHRHRQAQHQIPARRGAVIERIARCVQDAVDEADLTLKQVAGVGIGAPGAVDFDGGHASSSRRTWRAGRTCRSRRSSRRRWACRSSWRTTATSPPWACTSPNSKPSPSSMVGIFVGTGIGGGLIINGELYSGFSHTAGEIGHMVLEVNGPKCGCGNKGCFEALASRTAIFQRIKAGDQRRPENPPHRHAGRRPGGPAQRRPAQGHPPRRQVRGQGHRGRRRVHRHRHGQPGQHS